MLLGLLTFMLLLNAEGCTPWWSQDTALLTSVKHDVWTTVATPSMTPAGGTFSSDQTVTISCGTSGATIYYTTDGTIPTISSAVYSSPIAVAGNGTVITIKAFATKVGMNDSTVASATYIVTHSGTPPAPTAPSALTATSASASQIHLTWTDNSTNETGFRIERSPDGTGGWTEVYQAGADVTSWDDTGLTADTIYYYRVRAFNAGGDSAYSNTANATTGILPPAPPSALSAITLSTTQIHLAWTDNSNNETGFKVERSPDGTSGWTEVKQTGANEAAWDDAGLTAATAYYYRAKAFNVGGDSPYSDTANTPTRPVGFFDELRILAANDSFQMGDGLYGPNKPETISYDFWISRKEITNAQFLQFINDNGYITQSYWTANGWTWKGGTSQPAFWTDSNFNGANQPVVGVSWYEAVAFCNWRSLQDLLTPAYNSLGQVNPSASGYRLPTEVEWEYAAAKGRSGQAERIYAWGDTWDPNMAVCGLSTPPASKTADVGSKSLAGDTPQGLCDMSGNVREWCSDNGQSDASVASATDRYYFMDDSWTFLSRGGSWWHAGEGLFRCAYRYESSPSVRSDHDGFRVVRR
jgi:formylglycine-generating enzyme required for sulfatase activity